MNRNSLILQLPMELLIKIFSYVISNTNRLDLSLTCPLFHEIVCKIERNFYPLAIKEIVVSCVNNNQ